MTNFYYRFLFAIGGTSCNKSEYFTSVDKYDLDSNTWTRTTPMQNPRANHSSCSFGQTLYVFAGKNETDYLNSIESINASDLI